MNSETASGGAVVPIHVPPLTVIHPVSDLTASKLHTMSDLIRRSDSIAAHLPVKSARSTVPKFLPKLAKPGDIDWKFMSDVLKALYGSPRHGNPVKPLDSLIYVMLTRKTSIKKGREIFDRLKNAYKSWDEVADAPP